MSSEIKINLHERGERERERERAILVNNKNSFLSIPADSHKNTYVNFWYLSVRIQYLLKTEMPTQDFAKISQKLHGIERIWIPGLAFVISSNAFS